LTDILVVDDEHDVVVVADIALSRIGGYQVSVCTSGAEALDHLEQNSPDLVLLDVMMPDLDGPATLQRMRMDPRTARIPVAFVTARHQPRDLYRYRLLGVAGVIAKPFDPMALPSQVQNIWDGIHGPTVRAVAT